MLSLVQLPWTDFSLTFRIFSQKKKEAVSSVIRCWAFSTTSSLKGDGFIVTGNMSLSNEQQFVVTLLIPFVTADSWTTTSFQQEDSLEVGKNLCRRSASA